MAAVEDSTSIDKMARLLMATVPLVMGLSCIGGISFGALRHTGLFWMVTIVFGFILIPLRGAKKNHFPLLYWAPFCLYSGLSLIWSEMEWKNNVQLFVQMLLFPVVGIISSYTVRTIEQLERYNILYICGTMIIGVFCVYYMVGPGRGIQIQDGGTYAGFAERPAATSLVVVAAIFLAQIHKKPITAVMMWLLCFAICLLSESRMASLVLLSLWVIHPQLASFRMRCFLVAAVAVAGLAAFNTPIIQDRFFKKSSGFSGSGSLEDVVKGKFDSAGRFKAWPIVLAKSAEAPWLGHGLGQSVPFVYSVWAPMDKPHNEYLKTLYDGGYIGLSIFVFGLLGILIHLSRKLAIDRNRNWANAAAFMGWCGFILLSIVDNPLVYGNNFLHPLFFLIGAASGISASIGMNESNGEMDEGQQVSCEDQPVRRNLKPVMLR